MSRTRRLIGWRPYWRAQLHETARDASAFGSVLVVGVTCLLAAFLDRALALRLALGFAFVELAGNIVKLLVARERPVPQPHRDFLSTLDAASFPSLHTARAALICSVGNASAMWILPWAGATVAVATSRVILKKHYPRDVVAGSLLGVLLGLLVRSLMAAP